jgi:hypothetical protein
MDDRITITTPGGRRVEHLGTRPTYTYQQEALRAHLRDGAPLPIDADDALATMELIDACYRAAGFQPRPRTPPAACCGPAPGPAAAASCARAGFRAAMTWTSGSRNQRVRS